MSRSDKRRFPPAHRGSQWIVDQCGVGVSLEVGSGPDYRAITLTADQAIAIGIALVSHGHGANSANER